MNLASVFLTQEHHDPFHSDLSGKNRTDVHLGHNTIATCLKPMHMPICSTLCSPGRQRQANTISQLSSTHMHRHLTTGGHHYIASQECTANQLHTLLYILSIQHREQLDKETSHWRYRCHIVMDWIKMKPNQSSHMAASPSIVCHHPKTSVPLKTQYTVLVNHRPALLLIESVATLLKSLASVIPPRISRPVRANRKAFGTNGCFTVLHKQCIQLEERFQLRPQHHPQQLFTPQHSCYPRNWCKWSHQHTREPAKLFKISISSTFSY
jgi:hypothetical protein